jgi:hypothetical protein
VRGATGPATASALHGGLQTEGTGLFTRIRLKELPLMASMTSMAPSMAIDHVLMGLLMIF